MSKVIEEFIDELFVAIEKHNLQEAEECIETAYYIGVNKVLNSEKYGMTPISFAVKENSLEILRFLVNMGANVNAAGRENSSTALHVAAKYGREEAGQILLNHSADPNLQNTMGKTPSHLAFFHCQAGMVELLIKNKADPYIVDVDGNTALDIVGDDPEAMCNKHTRQRILSMLRGNTGFDDKAILPARSLKVALEASDTSSAVKPSSFVSYMFNWVGASTTAALSGLFQSTPALPPAQQPVTYSAGSSISSSQVDFSGIALLADVAIRKRTGGKYLRLLDDSLLTLEEIRERKLNAIKEKLNMAISKFEEPKYPGSSLNNATISKAVNHQRS